MNTVRHLSGIVAGGVGLLFSLGFLSELLDPQTDLAMSQALLFFVTLGVLPMIVAAGLLKKNILAVRRSNCPSCRSSEQAPAGVLISHTRGWAWQFGGWLLGALWGASRKRQVRCVQCDALYFTETRGSRIAGVLLWMFIVMLLLGNLMDAFIQE